MSRFTAFRILPVRLFALALITLVCGCEELGLTDDDSDSDLDFDLNVSTGYNHTQPGVESIECKLIETDPPQPSADFVMTVRGPTESDPSGVVPGQEFGGRLGLDGKARVQVRIRRFGTYENEITVFAKDGVPIKKIVPVTVGPAAGICP